MSRRLGTPARIATGPIASFLAQLVRRVYVPTQRIQGMGEKYISDWVVVDEDDCYQLFKSDAQTVWGRLIKTGKLYDNSLLIAVTNGD